MNDTRKFRLFLEAMKAGAFVLFLLVVSASWVVMIHVNERRFGDLIAENRELSIALRNYGERSALYAQSLNTLNVVGVVGKLMRDAEDVSALRLKAAKWDARVDE